MPARPAAPERPPATEAGTGDDDPPNWPDEAAESSFLAETKTHGAPAAAVQPREEARHEPLPKLDECVQRVPADAREALEELFRARFVSVKRVPESALKRG